MELSAEEVAVLKKLVPYLRLIPGGGDVGEDHNLTEQDDNALWSLIEKLKSA